MREFTAVVLGVGGVGKSALTLRFIENVFVDGYDPTIEETYRKTITVDGEACSLEVLDTAGTEQFKAINEYYIKGGTGFILVFSLTQEVTMREIEHLRQQIHLIKGVPAAALPIPASSNASTMSRPSTSGGMASPSTSGRRSSAGRPGSAGGGSPGAIAPGIPLVVVGTKSDLTHEREVSREMITRMSTLWGVPFYETSAKRDWNIKEVFEDVVRQMMVRERVMMMSSPKQKRRSKDKNCCIQ
jgi:Ras-related protein Rap-1A